MDLSFFYLTFEFSLKPLWKSYCFMGSNEVWTRHQTLKELETLKKHFMWKSHFTSMYLVEKLIKTSLFNYTCINEKKPIPFATNHQNSKKKIFLKKEDSNSQARFFTSSTYVQNKHERFPLAPLKNVNVNRLTCARLPPRLQSGGFITPHVRIYIWWIKRRLCRDIWRQSGVTCELSWVWHLCLFKKGSLYLDD